MSNECEEKVYLERARIKTIIEAMLKRERAPRLLTYEMALQDVLDELEIKEEDTRCLSWYKGTRCGMGRKHQGRHASSNGSSWSTAEADRPSVTVRQACRRRIPLDGTDSQMLEHALTQVEDELEVYRQALLKIQKGEHDSECASDQGSRDSDCMDDHRCYCLQRLAERALGLRK